MEDHESVPSVSIIVPVRNGASTIQALLESLQELDYDKRNVDVVVVDGNSTDKTRDIVKKYPVKLLVQQGDGLNAARNTGIKHSNGQILAFTDSDCVVPRNWVTKIVENFKDPAVSCVGGSVKGLTGDFVSEYADNSVVPLMPSFKKRGEYNAVKPFFRHPAGCNMAFRRNAAEEVGLFDENIRYGFDEVEFAERVCSAGYKMVLDPNVFVWHKHRATLKEFLKQNFGYGRGSGLILKLNKGMNEVSKWAFLSLLGLVAWIVIVVTSAFFSLTTTSILFPLLLFGFTIVPLLLPLAVYAFRALKHQRTASFIVYPLIDCFRTFSFCFGEVYQLLRKTLT